MATGDHKDYTTTTTTVMPSETKGGVEVAHAERAGLGSHDDLQKLGLWQAVKRWPKVTGYCLSLSSAILLWGYDLAMAGNLAGLDQFKESYGVFLDDDWIIASHWISAWDAGHPIGILIGSLFAGWLQDRKGRRLTLGLGSLTSVIGILIAWCSQYGAIGNSRNGIFLFGKVFLGFSIGLVVTATQTYMSEVLPSTLRGPILAFFPIFFLLGQLVSAAVVLGVEGVEGDRAFQLAIISQWPFSALPIVLSFLIPESPVYYVRKGKLDLAKKSQKRLSTSQDDVGARIEQIQVILLHEAEQAATNAETNYLECFKGTDLRRTLIAMFGAALPQLFGLSVLGTGAYFLQIGGMENVPSLIFVLSGVAGAIISNTISMYSLARWGRRTLILVTMVPITLLYVAMGVCGTVENSTSVWVLGVVVNLTVFAAGLGVWPASYCVAAEVSSLRLRSKTQGVAWGFGGVMNFVVSFIIPFIFNPDQGDLRAKIGYIWAGVCLLTTIGVWFAIPEMFRRTPLQLDLMFEQKTPARAFRAWKEDETS